MAHDGGSEQEKRHFDLPWDKVEDAYEILFENSILEVRDTFHCCVCNSSFAECSTALAHTMDAEHRTHFLKSERRAQNLKSSDALSYKLLVKAGLIASRVEFNLDCIVCGDRPIAFAGALRHIQGLAHRSKRAEFRLDSDDPREERTVAQACEAATRGVGLKKVSDASRSSEDVGNALCDYVVKKSYCRYYCVVCECDLDAEKKSKHIAGRNHEASLRQHACDAIALRHGRVYCCRVCDSDVVGLSEVFKHVMTQKHLAAAARAEDTNEVWMVRGKNNVYLCVLCDLPVFISETGAHTSGKYHENSLKLHGCENIERIEQGSYRCRCCRLSFEEDRELRRHVRDIGHLTSCGTLGPRTGEKLKDIDFDGSRPFSHFYILTIDEDEYRCVLCAADFSDLTGIPRHAATEAHKKFYDRYGCGGVSKIGKNVYYCDGCRSSIYGLWEVYSHVKREIHQRLADISASTKERGRETVSVRAMPKSEATGQVDEVTNASVSMEGDTGKVVQENTTKEKITKEEIARKRIAEEETAKKELRREEMLEKKKANEETEKRETATKAIGEEKIVKKKKSKKKSSAGSRNAPKAEYIRKHFILKAWDNIYFCFVCECPIYTLFEGLQSHLHSSFHTEAIRSYSCDRIIFGSNSYRCESCELELFNFQAVCIHVKTRSHMTRSRGVADCTNKAPSPVDCEPNETMYYVTVLDETTGFCEICDCKLNFSLRSENDNVITHVRGKSHKASLKRFGCENIQRRDLTYHCQYCDCSLEGLIDVYAHVKDPRHLTLAGKGPGKMSKCRKKK